MKRPIGPKHLPELIQAYNGMRSVITGYSLHYLSVWVLPKVPNRPPLPHNMEKACIVHVDDFVVMTPTTSL